MNSPYHFLLPEVESALIDPDFFKTAKKHATRYSYSEALLEVAEINPKVVVLDVDVGKSLKTNEFAKKYPHRSFNFGIAEQNMMAAAAGMARIARTSGSPVTTSRPRCSCRSGQASFTSATGGTARRRLWRCE